MKARASVNISRNGRGDGYIELTNTCEVCGLCTTSIRYILPISYEKLLCYASLANINRLLELRQRDANQYKYNRYPIDYLAKLV